MSYYLIQAMKVSLSVFWIVFILSIAQLISTSYFDEIVLVAIFLILAHIAEFVAIPMTLLKGKPIKINFVQTMLFGFGHWLPLLIEANKETK
jgi:uncharacterized protein YhhL (DUF1145 family)